MTCKHEHGDRVMHFGLWICGQCFEKMPARPQRLAMVGVKVPADWDGKRHAGSRQEVVWQADVIKTTEGTTLSQFIAAIAKRFIRRGGLDKDAAFEAAIDMLKMQGAQFGDPDYDWSRMSAIDLADEDMSYWDNDGPVGNT